MNDELLRQAWRSAPAPAAPPPDADDYAALLDGRLDPARREALSTQYAWRTLPMIVVGERFLGGFVSALGNLWPDFCLRIFKGREEQLGEALLDRVNQARAGLTVRPRASTVGRRRSMCPMRCRGPVRSFGPARSA